MPGTAPTGWQNPKTSYTAEDVLTPEQFERIEGNAYATELGARTIDPSQSPTGVIGTLRQLLDWFANRIRAITGTTNWYDAPPTTLTAAKSHIDAAAPHSGHATTAALTAHTSAAAPHSGHETPSGAQAKVDAHASLSAPHSGHATTTALNAHMGATSAHLATSAATANRIIMRDSAGRAKVAAPSAAADIARKDTVDAKFHPSTGHTHDGTTGNGPRLSYADLGGWVQPGDTVLLSSPEAASIYNNYRVNITKIFQVMRPGRYRIKGETLVTKDKTCTISVGMLIIQDRDSSDVEFYPAASVTIQGTSTYVPFSLDMEYPVGPFGFIMINMKNATTGYSYIRNVTVCYAEGGSTPVPSVIKSE